MNTLNLEVFSIIIIIIIIADYYGKFKKKFDQNSILFFKLSFAILFISLFNIIISNINFSNTITYLLIFTNYAILAFPPVFIALYIKKNFFNQTITKRYENINVLFCFIYSFLLLLFFVGHYYELSIIKGYYADIGPIQYFLLITLIPLIEKIIRYFIFIIKNKFVPVNRLFIIMIIPIIGVIIDLLIDHFMFIGPSYTISFLLLYLYRNNITLTIDPLTNIFNRRILETIELDNIMSPKKIACYLFDVDKFKSINDTYGHKKGDIILKDLANILKTSIRRSDYAIRYGGDEFLIIAFISSENDINVIVNKIRYKIDEYNKKSPIKLSVSVGYDIYIPKQYKNFELFIQKIDKDMYKDKEKKR